MINIFLFFIIFMIKCLNFYDLYEIHRNLDVLHLNVRYLLNSCESHTNQMLNITTAIVIIDFKLLVGHHLKLNY